MWEKSRGMPGVFIPHLHDIDHLPYRCPKCGDPSSFPSLLLLRQHLEAEHAYVRPSSSRRGSGLGESSGRTSPLTALLSRDARDLERQLTRARETERSRKHQPVLSGTDTVPGYKATRLRDTLNSGPDSLLFSDPYGTSEDFESGKNTYDCRKSLTGSLNARHSDGLRQDGPDTLTATTRSVNDYHFVIDRLKEQLLFKDSQLERANKELLKLTDDRRKLQRDVVELSRLHDNSTEQTAYLNGRISEKDRLIADKHEEIVQLNDFLRKTAIKESLARKRLEEYIDSLLRRTEKAEKKVHRDESPRSRAPHRAAAHQMNKYSPQHSDRSDHTRIWHGDSTSLSFDPVNDVIKPPYTSTPNNKVTASKQGTNQNSPSGSRGVEDPIRKHHGSGVLKKPRKKDDDDGKDVPFGANNVTSPSGFSGLSVGEVVDLPGLPSPVRPVKEREGSGASVMEEAIVPLRREDIQSKRRSGYTDSGIAPDPEMSPPAAAPNGGVEPGATHPKSCDPLPPNGRYKSEITVQTTPLSKLYCTVSRYDNATPGMESPRGLTLTPVCDTRTLHQGEREIDRNVIHSQGEYTNVINGQRAGSNVINGQGEYFNVINGQSHKLPQKQSQKLSAKKPNAAETRSKDSPRGRADEQTTTLTDDSGTSDEDDLSGVSSNSSVTEEDLSDVSPLSSDSELSESVTSEMSEQQLATRGSGKVRDYVSRSQYNMLFCLFMYLDAKALTRVAQVCKAWRTVSRDPALWRRLVLKNHKISSQFLCNLSSWCTRVVSLTLEGVKPRSIASGESKTEYEKHIRGSLEDGLEVLLRTNANTLVTLRIVDCGELFTDRCLWLASCYSRGLERVAYLSDTDPAGIEVIYSLGAGCRNISTLILPPMFPNQKPHKFTNRSVQLLSRCWRSLRVVCIGGVDVDVRGLTVLAKNCQQLQVLELDHMCEMTEDTAGQMCAAGLRALGVLDFTFTPVTPSALVCFASSCSRLHMINIHIGISDYYEDTTSEEHIRSYSTIVNKLKNLRSRPGLEGVLYVKSDYG